MNVLLFTLACIFFIACTVVQKSVCTDVSASELHGSVAVNIGQQAQTETLRVGWIGEPVYCEGGLGCVEDFAHPLVQLVVGDGAPERWLTVRHRLQV